MRIRIAILALACLTISLASAQTKGVKPDYKEIKKSVSDKKSEYYFPKLMERFIQRDTTMSHESYRHLYYGFTFQKEYRPYGNSDKMQQLQQYSDLDKLDKETLGKAMGIMNDVLKDDPFNLSVLNMLAYASYLNGDHVMAKKILGTFQNIIDTILSSGDGTTCETGFHVQSIGHEYAVLSIFGMESISQSLVDHCDYLQFEKGKYKIDGLYFDVTKMQENMMGEIGK